jgi:acid phosphatase family membrane protein YuiD
MRKRKKKVTLSLTDDTIIRLELLAAALRAAGMPMSRSSTVDALMLWAATRGYSSMATVMMRELTAEEKDRKK